MSNRLLLADSDAKSLRVLEVSLRNAGFQVSTAETGEAAWDAIQRDAPSVILADPDLPGLDGVALCARVRERASDRAVPFILVGTDKTVEARVRGLQAGADDYLVKPTYVNEVIARVRALIQRRERDKLASHDATPEAFQGKLSDITVVDLLEVLASNRRSGIIHLHGPRGATGAVYFRQGVVIDAEVGRLSGADAIGRLFAWTEGTFEVEWKNIRRPDAIGRPTADLVLEGMKRLEQKTRLAPDEPGRTGVYEVNYQVLADRLAEIPDEVNSILRLFDGSRGLAQVVEDSQLPDAEAMTVITRLRDEGIIVEMKPESVAPASETVPRTVGADNDSGAGGAGRQARAEAGSGPVGQSFADRMRSGAAARTTAPGSGPALPAVAADWRPPPPPPPAATKTDRGFPQLDLMVAPATGPGGGDAPQGPSRGEANLELLNSGGDPDPRERSADSSSDDNIIPFPIEGRASSERRAVVEAPADDTEPPSAASDEISPEELAALFGSTPAETPAVPSTDPGSGDAASPSGESAVPKVAPSMLQTQRGFGLPPPPPPPSDVPPMSPSPPLDGSAGEAAKLPAAPEPEAARAETTATPAPGSEWAAPASPPSTGRMATGPGGVVMVSTVAEATAQYNERDLSKREALDELGVPGRHRVLKILAGVLVLGAAGAVVVTRFRAQPAASSVVATTSADKRPASAASPAPRPPVDSPRGGGPASAAAVRPAETERIAAAEGAGAEAKNPSAGARPGPAARATDPAPERAAAPVADKMTGKAAEKVVEKKPSDARRSTDAEKSPSPDAFRQQLSECHALFSKNRFREAGVACGAAVQSNPRSAEALTMLAHVELNRGHMARAYELAQKAISIYPDQPDAYVIIGGVHQDGGRNEQAKAAYQRYLHLAPHGRYAVELRSIVGSL